MLCCYDSSRAIKNCTIDFNLLFKVAQGVFIAFDFVLGKMAIDDSNVSPTFAMLQSQFINDNRVW